MPLYEYQCDACGQRFEVIQKYSDPTPETCARCGKGPVHRLMSTPAIQFKGSGWYITDYAGGRSSAASTASSSNEGESKKDGDAKTPAATETTSKSESSSTTPSPSTSSKDSK